MSFQAEELISENWLLQIKNKIKEACTPSPPCLCPTEEKKAVDRKREGCGWAEHPFAGSHWSASSPGLLVQGVARPGWHGGERRHFSRRSPPDESKCNCIQRTFAGSHVPLGPGEAEKVNAGSLISGSV